jgi:hypothetical protein
MVALLDVDADLMVGSVPKFQLKPVGRGGNLAINPSTGANHWLN